MFSNARFAFKGLHCDLLVGKRQSLSKGAHLQEYINKRRKIGWGRGRGERERVYKWVRKESCRSILDGRERGRMVLRV